MTSSKKKLVIVGDGEFAEIAYEYFSHDSDYEVVGFAVEKEFLKRDIFYDLPVINFEDLESQFPKEMHDIFIAITFNKLNRVRTRLYQIIKDKGYQCATYISSKAFVWSNAIIGENCFIFENNVIQHHVKIGNNVILWSGNHVGHRSIIKDHCFVSSHVVISGYCEIGKSCFIGVNSTLANNLIIGDNCFVGAGCLITKNIYDKSVCSAPKVSKAEVSKLDSFKFFKIDESK